jgi:pyridoxamine 5'-phosphate oxidase family protein
MFEPTEVDFLTSQPLARLGTVSDRGQVDVSPVAFEFDGESFWIYSSIMERTFKGKNVAAGNARVSLVIDELSLDPHEPRGIKVHGVATLTERNDASAIRIRPTTTWSFGILEPGFQDGVWTTHKVTWPDESGV